MSPARPRARSRQTRSLCRSSRWEMTDGTRWAWTREDWSAEDGIWFFFFCFFCFCFFFQLGSLGSLLWLPDITPVWLPTPSDLHMGSSLRDGTWMASAGFGSQRKGSDGHGSHDARMRACIGGQ